MCILFILATSKEYGYTCCNQTSLQPILLVPIQHLFSSFSIYLALLVPFRSRTCTLCARICIYGPLSKVFARKQHYQGQIKGNTLELPVFEAITACYALFRPISVHLKANTHCQYLISSNCTTFSSISVPFKQNYYRISTLCTITVLFVLLRQLHLY